MERKHQLAGGLWSPVPGLCGAAVLGSDDAVLSAPVRIPGFDDATGIDKVGLYATAAVGAAFAAHTLVHIGKRAVEKRRDAARPAEPIKPTPAPAAPTTEKDDPS